MSEEVIKPVSVFDLVKIMTSTERKWSDLNDAEKKATEPFMIIMILSMHPDLLEIVNEFQRYAISSDLKPKEVYSFFNDILPKRSYYSPWVKGKNENSYSSVLIDVISAEYECSKSQAYEYLDLLTSINNIDAIIKIVSKYGYTESEIEAILLNKSLPKPKAPKKVATKKKK
jgi:hypothetical protein